MKYHIEVYELWSTTYEIEADSRAEAIAKFMSQPLEKDTPVPDSSVFIESDSERGMTRDEDVDLYDEVTAIDEDLAEEWGIRSVKSIEEAPAVEG